MSFNHCKSLYYNITLDAKLEKPVECVFSGWSVPAKKSVYACYLVKINFYETCLRNVMMLAIGSFNNMS